MDELYPGKSPGGSYFVTGFTAVSQSPIALPPPQLAEELTVGIHSFGPACFHIAQRNRTNPKPDFTFTLLTGKFLYEAIGFDPTFEFSMAVKSIGLVSYVRGAAARDYGRSVEQTMTSLRGTGGWYKDGLNINLQGELGEHGSRYSLPVLLELKHAYYAVSLNIPWMILRFVFFNEMGLITENYQNYGQ